MQGVVEVLSELASQREAAALASTQAADLNAVIAAQGQEAAGLEAK